MNQGIQSTSPNGGIDASAVEQVLITGDLAKLSANERLGYYRNVCLSLGLNPLTKPFEYITLNGRLVLYAKRDATDQLRRIYGVSVTISSRLTEGGVHTVTARAVDAHGRSDESVGAVAVDGLRGDALANAYMKAETKAKRRVTLSICGLGMLDETELETIPTPAGGPSGALLSEPTISPAAAETGHIVAAIERLKGEAVRLGIDPLTFPDYSPDQTADELKAVGKALKARVEVAMQTRRGTGTGGGR